VKCLPGVLAGHLRSFFSMKKADDGDNTIFVSELQLKILYYKINLRERGTQIEHSEKYSTGNHQEPVQKIQMLGRIILCVGRTRKP
jgi:hypothetical protein